MSAWLTSNLGTIIVSLILAGIVAAIIVNMMKKDIIERKDIYSGRS